MTNEMMALQALAPPMESFAESRDFAAWTGRAPTEHLTGGKADSARTSRMGQRYICRPSVAGASTVVRWARRNGAVEGGWLARMLAGKAPMLVMAALADKVARIARAIMRKNEFCRDRLAA